MSVNNYKKKPKETVRMCILIDTNIFIYRENSNIIPSNLQSLLKTLNDLVVQILVHPLAARELESDKNQRRRGITLSKIKTYLVELIEKFGFYKVAEKNEEAIFIKTIVPDEKTKNPLEISSKFYPSFYDGARVEKFIVPIRPEYHNRLFTDYQPIQTTLQEFEGELIIECNTIKKAYLSHSRIRIPHEKYLLIKQGGGINERFTVN